MWTWPQIVKATCRLLMRTRIDDCHWSFHSIATTKKLQQQLHKLISTTLLTTLQSIANWVSNFPSRLLTRLKPKYFCPSDTHWHEYGLRILYYCIFLWGRPVFKSRQIELSHIARNFELTCAAFDTWQNISRSNGAVRLQKTYKKIFYQIFSNPLAW